MWSRRCTYASSLQACEAGDANMQYTLQSSPKACEAGDARMQYTLLYPAVFTACMWSRSYNPTKLFVRGQRTKSFLSNRPRHVLYLSSRCIFSSVHHEPVRVSSRQVEISFTRAICEANSACRATGLPRGPKNDRLKSKNRAFDNSPPSQILWSSCCLRNRTSSALHTRPAKAFPGYLISKHRGSPEKPKACHCSFARKDASDACKLRGHSTPESHGRSDLTIFAIAGSLHSDLLGERALAN